MKGIYKVPLLITVFFILVFVGFLSIEVANFNKRLESNPVVNVNLRNVKDGNYTGLFDVRFIMAEVQVHMKNGIMIDLVLIHHEHGKDHSAEAIIEEIKTKQSLDVDLITGATSSSKVILKAVEIALKKGLMEPEKGNYEEIKQ
jgi:uncharacterized protein with FMN-binding domain